MTHEANCHNRRLPIAYVTISEEGGKIHTRYGGYESWHYEENGNSIKIEIENGIKHVYIFDAKGREISCK